MSSLEGMFQESFQDNFASYIVTQNVLSFLFLVKKYVFMYACMYVFVYKPENVFINTLY